MAGQKVPNGLDLQGKRAENVLDPAQPQDAATKNYVDLHSGAGSVQVVDGGAVMRIWRRTAAQGIPTVLEGRQDGDYIFVDPA